MPLFNGLGVLAEPTPPQDLLDPDLPQLEENLRRVLPPEPRPPASWSDRVPAMQPPGTGDTGISSWHPQGVPEYGFEGNPATGEPPASAYPSLRGKVFQEPNEENPAGQRQQDLGVPPRPELEPIALRRFTTNSGVPFTMDELSGPKMKAFLDEMEKVYPIDPKQSAGYNRRYIAGTNTPSAHGDLGGEIPRAFDYNWTANPRGARGQFDDATVRGILSRHPDIEWGADWSNPDRMHFQVRRSALGAPTQQPRGTGKMDDEVQSIGALVDPEAQAGTRSPKVARAAGMATPDAQGDMYKPDPRAAPFSSWGEMVDSGRRNAIITAGLHMMTGGYGLGSALGAGLESLSSQNAAMSGQLAQEQKYEEASTEKERDRASREKVAETSADSRERVAEARIQAMLERTRMNLEAKVGNASLALRYRTEARKIVEGNINNLQLSQSEREVMTDQLASQMYDTDVARGRVPQGAGPQNSAGGPDYSGMGGGEAPAKKPAAPAAEKSNAPTSLEKLANDPTHGARVREMLKTPEGQQELLKLNPRLKDDLRYYQQGSGAYGPDAILRMFGM